MPGRKKLSNYPQKRVLSLNDVDVTKYCCKYLSDSPNDYRILVKESSSSEHIFRVLGHSAEVNPFVELVASDKLVSSDQISEMINQVLRFHFGIDDPYDEV